MASQAKPRSSNSSKGRSMPFKPKARTEKRKQFQEDIKKLQESVDAFDPKAVDIKHFSDLPLSEPTSTGLQASHFQDLTDIQAGAIPLALKGRDILGAAKTGSGKTLAFLVPVLEKLYRAKWTELDGLGALVISPTRELAAQIFEVLRKVGRNHAFSAGLVIGGKSLKEEAERLARMNILVCTPGRMLQHLDQTAGLAVDNLQILVLDEADRIMDMGFQSAVDALVEHLPDGRQTLMFSATQSKRVSDLARLSLKDPEYVAVHEAAKTATPSTLQQHYITTPLPEKLDTLYGFVKANLKSKMIVFLSSGKQVRFVYESFRNMQPGIPLLHLHGRQKQTARFEITSRFTSAQHACLFATDVVARGVDFPAVDWVIQVDCPEDADTYIHRVGRTARNERAGRAVLFLDPSEEACMLKRLEQRKVPIQKVSVKETKKRSINDQLQVLCFQKPDLKYLAQKAFVSYARSVHLQKDKEIFKLFAMDLDGFAASMGLPGTPLIKFQKGQDIKTLKNAPRGMLSSDSETGSNSEDEPGAAKTNKKNKTTKKKPEVRTKYDRMFERTNQDVLSSHYTKMIGDDDDDGSMANADGGDDDEAFLTVKRRLLDGNDEEGNAYDKTVRAVKMLGDVPFIVDSKRREKMLRSKKQMLKYTARPERIVFDEDGRPRSLYEMKTEEDFRQEGAPEDQRQRFLQSENTKVREADLDDREMARQRKKEKRAKRKAREALGTEEEARAVAQTLADGEDPLALMRSLPLNKGGRGGSGSDDGDDEPPRKKAKKWFPKDSGDEEAVAKKRKKGSKKVLEIDHEPEGLEDLEALATGLLDD